MKMTIPTIWGTTTRKNGDIFNTFDRLASGFFSEPSVVFRPIATGPQTNVSTNDKGYNIQVSVPGVDKSQIEINVENNVLTVSHDTGEETTNTFATQSFQKTWTLPEGTDAEFITAECVNGILSVDIPKTQKSISAREITVK